MLAHAAWFRRGTAPQSLRILWLLLPVPIFLLEFRWTFSWLALIGIAVCFSLVAKVRLEGINRV